MKASVALIPNVTMMAIMMMREIFLGWCETPSGFMYVCECNKCFTKYRYHGVTGSYKFNFNKFASSFLLSVLLQKDKDDPSCIDISRCIKSKDEPVELKEE